MKMLKIILSLSLILIFSAQSFASTATESINNFAFNAAKILEYENGEYFFSPYSILSAFGMAYAGAEGNTAREIEENLGFTAQIHSQLGELMQDFEVEKAFSAANRVWLRNGLKLKDAYKDILLLNYKSSAQKLDFLNKTEASRKKINAWVSEKTNGKILNLLQQLEPDTQMILTNAVYFNAEWESKFNKKFTSEEDFFSDGCIVDKVTMMKKHDDFLYAERDGSKIIKIPYKGGRFSLIVFLPPKTAGYPGTLEDGAKPITLDADIFKNLLDSMSEYEVDLWLPKFKIEKSYELKDLFDALGIKLAFSDFADFSGITGDEKLKIDAVIHKTFIDVDEEKTEAAAATAIKMMKATAIAPVKKPQAEFHADHPFRYFILDNYTGTILFAGRQTFGL